MSIRRHGGLGQGPGMLAVLLVMAWSAGCSCGTPIDLGAMDGGAWPGTRDECGNGLDDDGDGRIDEGCFCGPSEIQECYPSGRLGACGPGRQACRVEGTVEWGRWSDCDDAPAPSDEVCEGSIDEDCDGSVDEGCPCEEGQTQSCASEFGDGPAPCTAGTQTCRGGGWSSCEGAVVPVAEVCNDGVDNDCDGTVDDPSVCDCRPAPERCGNGIDDDCDGEIDEPDACVVCPDESPMCADPGDAGFNTDAGARPDAGNPPDAGVITEHQCWFIKASNTDAGDIFANAVLSADGLTLAVGAPREDSSATGVDGDQSDNSAFDAGAVYVFSRVGDTWVQAAYLKASNTDAGDSFGSALSLSADGTLLVVGANSERGNGSSQADNSEPGAGAAYVFALGAGGWAQQAYLKAPDIVSGRDGEFFGRSVSISGDGSTIAIGADDNESGAQGTFTKRQNDVAVTGSGAVYVFRAQGDGSWELEALLKAHNNAVDPSLFCSPCSEDHFGGAVAISHDGDTLVVGARGEGSSARGIDGDAFNNAARRSGAAYIFVRSGTSWSQQAYLKASNSGAEDLFGGNVSITADGNLVLIGAARESSSAVGLDGDGSDDSSPSGGAAYLFSRSGNTWTQLHYVKPSNRGNNFGRVSQAADGSRFLVGAIYEPSAAIGLDGDQTDTSAPLSGAGYLFDLGPSGWYQRHYVKSPYIADGGRVVDGFPSGDLFGATTSMNRDGTVAAFGVSLEGSASTGVGGDPLDNSAPQSGAVIVCTFPR